MVFGGFFGASVHKILAMRLRSYYSGFEYQEEINHHCHLPNFVAAIAAALTQETFDGVLR